MNSLDPAYPSPCGEGPPQGQSKQAWNKMWDCREVCKCLYAEKEMIWTPRAADLYSSNQPQNGGGLSVPTSVATGPPRIENYLHGHTAATASPGPDRSQLMPAHTAASSGSAAIVLESRQLVTMPQHDNIVYSHCGDVSTAQTIPTSAPGSARSISPGMQYIQGLQMETPREVVPDSPAFRALEMSAPPMTMQYRSFGTAHGTRQKDVVSVRRPFDGLAFQGHVFVGALHTHDSHEIDSAQKGLDGMRQKTGAGLGPVRNLGPMKTGYQPGPSCAANTPRRHIPMDISSDLVQQNFEMWMKQEEARVQATAQVKELYKEILMEDDAPSASASSHLAPSPAGSRMSVKGEQIQDVRGRIIMKAPVTGAHSSVLSRFGSAQRTPSQQHVDVGRVMSVAPTAPTARQNLPDRNLLYSL